VFSGRGPYDELITRPEESYRLWCVVVCDLETSRMGRPWLTLCRIATGNKNTLLYADSAVLAPFDTCTYTKSNTHFANSLVVILRDSDSSVHITVRAPATRYLGLVPNVNWVPTCNF
jgi:hypothetical protein